MNRAPELAELAALLAEPARARMLTALMGGLALTATELALEGEIAPSTASAHLAKLAEGEVVVVERHGRHRYFRLASSAVATVIEELTSVAATRRLQRRPRPIDPALRSARVCYDHLAGERAVWLLERLRQRGDVGADGCTPTASGAALFERWGLDVIALARQRRTLGRLCLDWSERRHHLGGALGAALLSRIFELGWAHREAGGRTVAFSARGDRCLRELLS